MIRKVLLAFTILAAPRAAAPDDCTGRGIDWLPPVLLDIEAPQGIAVDTEDGSLWICSAISSEVTHVSKDLQLLGKILSPFAAEGKHETGGIAYREDTDTLLISHPLLAQIREVLKDGTPTGLVVQTSLPPPPTLFPRPFIKGMEYDSLGDGGRGSIWVVESGMTAVYEVNLEGAVLSSFCAPDDLDGCPGEGRASSANDIGLLRDAQGKVAGFEMTTGAPYRDRLWRLDALGQYKGNWIDLAGLGGNLGGFDHGRAVDRRSGESREVLWATVESKAELHAVLVTEPLLLGIEGLSSSVEGSTVKLQWQSYGSYESVQVFRDGELAATLPGSAVAYEDSSPPDGIIEYEVAGTSGACEARAATIAVTGAGQVLRDAPFEGYWAVDLTEDGSENLWVTDSKNRIVVHDKDLNVIVSFPGPFQEPDDETTGIAYNPASNTVFVYNASTNEIAEINDLGEVVSGPFPSGVPNDPDNPAGVSSLLFNPAGAGGAGSFWLLDINSARLEERGRSGLLLSSCVHPDHAAEPPPPDSRLGAYAFGVCEAPGGASFELYVSGGRVREQRATRIFRASSACAELEEELTTAGIEAVTGNSYLIALHRTQHAGKDVFYAIDSLPYRSRLLELETRPPPALPVRGLSCSQPGDARSVRIEFTPLGPHDSIEVLRDGDIIATLPSGSTSHADTAAPAGLREYEVRSVRGADRSDGRQCTVRVGAGSRSARDFAGGRSFLSALALDPTDGSYLAASSLNTFSNDLHRFDKDLHFVESFPAPFQLPEQTGALAVREVAGGVEIYCLGWRPGVATPLRELPIHVIDRTGAFLRRTKLIPPAPRGGFVTYPAGLVYDRSRDTFWFHERNAFAIAEVAPDGAVLRVFPHPAPSNQYKVENFGIGIDPDRGVLFLSSAAAEEHEVTRLVELTRGGLLTGVEIPIGVPEYQTFGGFVVVPGNRDITAASKLSGSVWDLVRYRAYDPVEPVRSLTCRLSLDSASLEWTSGEAYDSVLIYRGTELVATLPGSSTAFADAFEHRDRSFYRIAGALGELQGPGTVCEVDPGVFFVRGDVEENGVVNITDAIAILLYLFSGGATPRCLDSADTDDSGEINITDAVALLGYLFTSGRPPAAPFPDRGVDESADPMHCGG